MRSFARVVLGALVVGAAQVAKAQTEGPVAGTWAAEAANGGGASLLRFRSPNAAWLFGVNATYARVSSEFSGTEQTDEDWFAQARIGHRWYSSSDTRLRRFSTLSGIVGYNGGDGPGWVFGASGELGAAWFFSPHVSLGTSAELSATRFGSNSNGPSAFINELFTIQLNGFRLLGAVYF